MKLKRLLFISAMLSLLFISCSEENAEIEVDIFIFEIDSSYLKLDVRETGGVTKIPVKTNLDWAKISFLSNQGWCTVSKDGTEENYIRISYDKSEEAYARRAEISVKSSVQNYIMIVEQLGINPQFLISLDSVKFAANGGKAEIKITANIEYTVTKSKDSDWLTEVLTEVTTKGLKDTVYYWEAEASPLADRRMAVLYYNEKDGPTKDSCIVIQEGKVGDLGDIEAPSDMSVKPTSGIASEHQSGAGIENTWNGLGKSYHSAWAPPNGAGTKFPVTLEYFFDQKPNLDYLIYHPTGGNGNFGKLEIYTATKSSPEYSLLGEYNFRMKITPSKVSFSGGLKEVTKIKFVVNSGGGNFVSCKEMQFLQKSSASPLEAKLLEVFTDLTCSEVNEGVKPEAIYALPNYFVQLAMRIQNNEYDEHEKNFRIREYEAYSNVEEWGDKLMTKRYSNLDNSTGIHANAGDTILVLVGNTHGNEVTLQSIKEVEPSGDVYFLKEGINKVYMKNKGMLFLMYTASPSQPPIKVHIPFGNGIVDGFFDLDEHKTDAKYAETLRKATHKYFFVRGKKHIFYFHREALLKVVPDEILSAVHLWDDMVSWQQELMGIDDIRPMQVNNHMMAISTESAYMWASDYRMGYIHTYLHNILLKENVNAVADNAWGPAHEMGHVHQQAINWPGCTESSNNLFSNYAIYKLGEWCSRGTELSVLAKDHFIDKSAFPAMSGGISLHLRMNWQLWNYFHRCGHDTKFWPKLFKALRTEGNRINMSDAGAGQMQFAKLACEVANQDLTDFFEMWGFFIPFDGEIGDYGTYQYTVTQAMIDEVKAEMATYSTKMRPFQYIEDRKNGDRGIGDYKVGDVGHYSQFIGEPVKMNPDVSYKLRGRTIEITKGENAVAFEIKRNNQLIYFSNFFNFQVPDQIFSSDMELYAVQADGNRIKIPKEGVINVAVAEVIVDTTILGLMIRDTYTLVATVKPMNATDKHVTWESSNTTIATVSAAGFVTAKKTGVVQITAIADGKRSVACIVTVTKDPNASEGGNEGVTEGDGIF